MVETSSRDGLQRGCDPAPKPATIAFIPLEEVVRPMPAEQLSRTRDRPADDARMRHFRVSCLTRPQKAWVRGEITMPVATYQRSTSKPATRENSRALRVTSTCELAMAMEAIMRSFPPMGLPSRRSCALTIP